MPVGPDGREESFREIAHQVGLPEEHPGYLSYWEERAAENSEDARVGAMLTTLVTEAIRQEKGERRGDIYRSPAERARELSADVCLEKASWPGVAQSLRPGFLGRVS